MDPVTIGVIGGSGLYAMDGLDDVSEVNPDTAFGKPSDAITVASLGGIRLAFGEVRHPDIVHDRTKHRGVRLRLGERDARGIGLTRLRVEATQTHPGPPEPAIQIHRRLQPPPRLG